MYSSFQQFDITSLTHTLMRRKNRRVIVDGFDSTLDMDWLDEAVRKESERASGLGSFSMGKAIRGRRVYDRYVISRA